MTVCLSAAAYNKRVHQVVTDYGSCTLSSCKAQSLSAYVLGVARRHRTYVDVFIVLTVLGILCFLAADCIGNCRLSSVKSAKSAKSSL